MLRVGATALVLCGLMGTPVLAAPMAGIDAQFYPNEYNPPAFTGVVPEDFLNAGGTRGDASISDADLKKLNGGSGIVVLDDAQINLTNANAAIGPALNIGVNTGGIGDQALQNVSGINTIMQNTGNSVVMQSINNVNIVLK